jgi:hypothetical protein
MVEAASNPTHGCRGPVALANKSGVSGTGLTLRSSWCLDWQATTNVALTGRATTVPFTTDTSGCKRTPTDNLTAAMTCAVRCLAQVATLPDLALQAGGRGFESPHLHHQHERPAQQGCRRPLTRLTGARYP